MVACYDDRKDKISDGGSIRFFVTGFTRGMYTNDDRGELPCKPYEVDEVANAFIPEDVDEDSDGL
jgi:hypothetical protein